MIFNPKKRHKKSEASVWPHFYLLMGIDGLVNVGME